MGCGWLGWPLAQALVAQGYRVQGSTLTPEKSYHFREKDVEPFYIDVGDTVTGAHLDTFFNVDILCVLLPYRRNFKDPQIYQRQMQAIISLVQSSTIQKVVFTSSTSIYPQMAGKIMEDTPFVPETPRATVLHNIERLWLELEGVDTTILRLAGLCGGERQITGFLQKQQVQEGALLDGERLVNLIHREDCVVLMQKVIQQNFSEEIFNLCSDKHPSRQELYTQVARRSGLVEPSFKASKNSKKFLSTYKQVSNVKIKRLLAYTFRYPDPLTFPLE